MKYTDIMIDIETMSTKSDAAIISIAAVEFNRKGEIGACFYKNIDLQSCIDLGCSIDGDTVMWWLSQSKEAQDSLKENRLSILSALESLDIWLNVINEVNEKTYERRKNLKIWGNPNSFDLTILKNAYLKLKKEVPWNWKNEMDLKTIVSFAPEIKKEQVFKGVAHNAVDDCIHQINYLIKTLNKLKL